MRLAELPWCDRPGARRIIEVLGGTAGETRIVGGAVRDTLLGLAVADVDLATRLEPAEVIRRLEANGLRAVPTGLAHGTVTALAPGAIIEVTTLRRDVSTDGRHAVVSFTGDWRADAARRDFTFNALYAHPCTGEITDFFDGVRDLEQGRVRFIGEPLQRIAEDRLRILRFFRFHARFGRGDPDPSGLAACIARAEELTALSPERIRDELLKLLCVADPVPTLALMLAAGVLFPVLPELDAARLPSLAALVRCETAARQQCEALRRLALLVAPDQSLLEELSARLKLSTAQRARLMLLARREDPELDRDMARLAYRLGVEAARDLMLVRATPDEATQLEGALARLDTWDRPRLPVAAADLLDLGVKPGPLLGATLRALEERWLASGFRLSRDALLEEAGRLLRGAPDARG